MQWPDQFDTLKKDLPAHLIALIQYAIDERACSIEEIARALEVSKENIDSILDGSKDINDMEILFLNLMLALDLLSHEIEGIFGVQKIDIRDTDFSVNALKHIAQNEMIRKQISDFFVFYNEFKSLKLEHFKKEEIDRVEYNLLEIALHGERSYEHKFAYPDFIWQLLDSSEFGKKYTDFCSEILAHFIAAGFSSLERINTSFDEGCVVKFLLDDETILDEDEDENHVKQKLIGLDYRVLFWLSDVDAKEIISQLFEKLIAAQNAHKNHVVFEVYDASYYMMTISNILRDWDGAVEVDDPFGGWAGDWSYFKDDSYVIFNMEVPLHANQVEYILNILGYKVEFYCNNPEAGKHFIKVFFPN